MTRLWVLSDLHLTHDRPVAREGLRVPDADVCVCAGDVFHGTLSSLAWLAEFVLPHMPVVFVPGNHEYYGRVLADDRQEFTNRYLYGDLPEGLHYLDCRHVYVGNVKFLGATLWTDFAVFSQDGDEKDLEWFMATAERSMNDYRAILYDHRAAPLKASHTRELHWEARNWLRRELRVHHDEGPTVVVTHHAPHPGSIDAEFRDDPLTAAYASDLEGLMRLDEPQLWVHGHTHVSFDYQVGRTRVLCNPKGYGSENPRFNPQLVVEL
jgi:Icc-related predicted phosphoesterase